jgi:RNA polymerase sigma-70 factor (ECF subfamily)
MKNSWIGGESTGRAESPAGRLEEQLAVAVHWLEAGAFERLIDRFEQPLASYAQGLLQNAGEAREVVKEALLRAYRKLTRQYDAERCSALALRPWLFRMVRNLALRRRRVQSDALESPLESFDDGRLGPFVGLQESDVARRQHVQLFRRALSLLPADARELIVLRFVEEMSYAEIAKTVGLAEGTLRGKVFRSLKLLNEALEQKGVAYAM